jgi:ribosome-associated toxin RatA of RatAB toxin-antitoxin module
VVDQQVTMKLISGPFSTLEGEWNFVTLGAEQRACRVELALSYGFDTTLGKLVSPVFDRIAASMVDAFIKRAKQVYGE